MNQTISPRVVLVTGSGSGIGRAIAISAARAGHHVYASMRGVDGRNAGRRDEMISLANNEALSLTPIELDVLFELSCRAAVDLILLQEKRIDVVVNNAGMLMNGIGEGFSPEQFLKILDTNAVSWLRVNRAVLPVMRRQGGGLVVYIGSTTARLVEPFMAPYAASKAAGEALAESMGPELRPFGIESTVVVPGAFVDGTEHFAHANSPENVAVAIQYGDVAQRPEGLGVALARIDSEEGGPAVVGAVGDAVRDLIAVPRGKRPTRIHVDPQNKGMPEIDALIDAKQRAFLSRLGLGDLLPPG